MAETYSTGRKRLGHLYFGFLWRTRLILPFIRPNTRVLDIGAADGAMLEYISTKIPLQDWVSLESSPELVQKIPRKGLLGRATDIPLPDASFDHVICSATRKHIKDSPRMAAEIARVLKPGGSAIVLDPHPLVLRLGVKIGKFDPRYLHHYSSARDIQNEFESAGLTPLHRSTGFFVYVVAQKPSRH